MLHARRYLPGTRPFFVDLIERVHELSFEGANRFYRTFVPRMRQNEVALLAANDRYFLLTHTLDRADAINPWLYARVREVEADPDGYLDLWARYHYKSTIITFAGSIEAIIRDPEVTIAIFAATNAIARPFLEQIKEELETNDTLKRLYPDVFWEHPKKQAGTWSKDRGIVVKRKTIRKEMTIEAYGLVEALPTSRHFDMLIYDDLVTQDLVDNDDVIRKVNLRWEMSDNLGSGASKTRKRMIGTRYCTRGDQRVLMGDWSHRKIEDVVVGDTVIGWVLEGGKRWLRSVKVVDRGSHFNQPVRRFRFENGRSVVCTADHRWWRGAHGGGPEYAPLCLPRGAKGHRPAQGLSRIRQLLVPTTRRSDREAGWLAGFYDGEGTFQKNKNHPSGNIAISQTMSNPTVIQRVRDVLGALNFKHSEGWHIPSIGPETPLSRLGNKHLWKDRCTFHINGGWRERYRFLVEIAPERSTKIAASLFGQLMTEGIKVVADDDVGSADVHWLQTESGNYVVEGFCSSNSFNDSYAEIIDTGTVQVRLHPATHDGTEFGKPVFISEADWENIKRTQRNTYPAQMLQNPLAGKNNIFLGEHLRPYHMRPRTLNVYIMGDPSMGKRAGTGTQLSVKKSSDRTAIVVIGIDSAGNKYLLDGMCHRMKLSERWANLKRLYLRWQPPAERESGFHGEAGAEGVMNIEVGWERYGMQSDLEYFQEKMLEKGNPGFLINELSWTREGDQSKKARVQRLEPDFRENKFYVPAKVWRSNVAWAERGSDAIRSGPRVCLWGVEDAGTVVYRPIPLDGDRGNVPMLTRQERMAIAAGERFRLVNAIMRVDEDDKPYDLTSIFFNEYLRFPFAPHDDLIDAMSRIYDMRPIAAEVLERDDALPTEYEYERLA